MKNKKKVLTVLFAAILAFIAVFFIFRFEHKKTEQVTPEQKIEEQNEILDTTDVKNEDNKQVIEQNVKESIKVQENKTNVKQAIKPTTKKGTVKVPVLKPTEEKTPIQGEATKTEEDVVKPDELEKEVVVPVKYVTRNTYRYVYTPAKFKKK